MGEGRKSAVPAGTGRRNSTSFLRRPPGDGTHAPMAKAAGICRPLAEDSMPISAYQNVRFWHLADI